MDTIKELFANERKNMADTYRGAGSTVEARAKYNKIADAIENTTLSMLVTNTKNSTLWGDIDVAKRHMRINGGCEVALHQVGRYNGTGGFKYGLMREAIISTIRHEFCHLVKFEWDDKRDLGTPHDDRFWFFANQWFVLSSDEHARRDRMLGVADLIKKSSETYLD